MSDEDRIIDNFITNGDPALVLKMKEETKFGEYLKKAKEDPNWYPGRMPIVKQFLHWHRRKYIHDWSIKMLAWETAKLLRKYDSERSHALEPGEHRLPYVLGAVADASAMLELSFYTLLDNVSR
jgi:hypothetical protein